MKKEENNLVVWVLWLGGVWHSYRFQFQRYLRGPGVPDVRDAEVWAQGRKMNVRLEG